MLGPQAAHTSLPSHVIYECDPLRMRAAQISLQEVSVWFARRTRAVKRPRGQTSMFGTLSLWTVFTALLCTHLQPWRGCLAAWTYVSTLGRLTPRGGSIFMDFVLTGAMCIPKLLPTQKTGKMESRARCLFARTATVEDRWSSSFSQ
ncbi:hypothetical protein BD310DRAFT_302187 [Dichomitus squalens]|uniref:Uncharacterized protein n=1 Tax=Dichomitus squalens TaxID=114155 RepID=A0A4V2K9T2_9APHY|nr:hypothetical protein BD310DRAFT_302187 [Dichomitus squalens]